ncbi:MAG: hypothetical protein JXR96_22295 [Deltaproteobacteria bacterium]|nr:hypothetical protein [Deltaproteobacteria bacterium]
MRGTATRRLRALLAAAVGMLAAAMRLSGCVAVGHFAMEIVIPDDAKDDVVQLDLYALIAEDDLEAPCTEVQDERGEVNDQSFRIAASTSSPLPLPADGPLLSEVPTGRIVFYGIGRDEDGDAILRGCVEADIDVERDARVTLELEWACGGADEELCGNGFDDDCDGLTDEEC